MDENEIKFALVDEMWSADCVEGNFWGEASSIARNASIPRSAEGDAKELLADMADDPDCPVIAMTGTKFTLHRDKDAIRDYLLSVGDSDDLPWDLK